MKEHTVAWIAPMICVWYVDYPSGVSAAATSSVIKMLVGFLQSLSCVYTRQVQREVRRAGCLLQVTCHV
jgi:hypothetical protein